MEKQILKLRSEGKTYSEIQKILGCSKSTVSYHCGKGQKEKNLERGRQYRINNKNVVLKRKMDKFTTSKLRTATSDFKRGPKRNQKNKAEFTYKDVLNKFGEDTNCYLTGRSINLFTNEFHFDHIIPTAQGGGNTLCNLGITCPNANISKNAMTVEEYLFLCKEVLEYNGYTVVKKP